MGSIRPLLGVSRPQTIRSIGAPRERRRREAVVSQIPYLLHARHASSLATAGSCNRLNYCCENWLNVWLKTQPSLILQAPFQACRVDGITHVNAVNLGAARLRCSLAQIATLRFAATVESRQR